MTDRNPQQDTPQPPAQVADGEASEPKPAKASADEKPDSEATHADSKRHLNADGRERPRFLLDFPSDPELSALALSFERGDYASVRVGAPKLAERTQSEAVRTAALELYRRIEPDPLIKYLLVIAVLLLAFLTMYAYQSHAH